MDLTGALLRVAAATPRVLVVPQPGGTAVRLAVEREVRVRGWPTAVSPADTDILVVCGPVSDGFAPLVDEVWRAVPAPRVLVGVDAPTDTVPALAAARRGLADADLQRVEAARTTERQQRGDPSPGRGDDPGPGHEHGGGELVSGLPMAGRAPDRDGLRLDELHRRLGPVLADWPAGLVVDVVVHGDVIHSASAHAMPPVGWQGSFWTEPWRRAAAGEPVTVGQAARWRAAAHLDSLGRFLGVAGWADAAVAARRLRDDLLAGTPGERLWRRAERVVRRVSRSRTLRWSTRGLGVLTSADAAATGTSGMALSVGEDVTARYQRWLAEMSEDMRRLGERAPLPAGADGPRGRLTGGPPSSAALVAALPGLLAGVEFAGARLIVASVDPDIDELAAGAVLAGG